MRISTKRSSIDGDISLLMIYLEHCQKQEKTFKSKLDLVAKLPHLYVDGNCLAVLADQALGKFPIQAVTKMPPDF